jgi:integrase
MQGSGQVLLKVETAERRKREDGCCGGGYRYSVDPASPYVLPSHTGDHLSAWVVGKILSRALGPGWTGHKLRHRFATLAYAVDRDLLTVQQLLGHSSPQTTAIYIETSPDAAAAAVAGVAA